MTSYLSNNYSFQNPVFNPYFGGNDLRFSRELSEKLMDHCFRGEEKEVNALLNRGVSIEVLKQRDENDYTALMHASSSCNANITEKLIDYLEKQGEPIQELLAEALSVADAYPDQGNTINTLFQICFARDIDPINLPLSEGARQLLSINYPERYS